MNLHYADPRKPMLIYSKEIIYGRTYMNNVLFNLKTRPANISIEERFFVNAVNQKIVPLY